MGVGRPFYLLTRDFPIPLYGLGFSCPCQNKFISYKEHSEQAGTLISKSVAQREPRKATV